MALEQESLTSNLVVKAFGREEFEEKRFASQNQKVTDAAVKARRLKALVSPTVNLVVGLGTALVMWFGALQILGGKGTIGDLIVFLGYLTKMFKPMQDLSKMSNTIAKAWVGMDRIISIMIWPVRSMKPKVQCRHEISAVKSNSKRSVSDTKKISLFCKISTSL